MHQFALSGVHNANVDREHQILETESLNLLGRMSISVESNVKESKSPNNEHKIVADSPF